MLSRDLLIFQRPLLTFARSTDERMMIVSGCALLGILQSALTDNGNSILIALCACLAAAAAELAINLTHGRLFLRDGSCIVTALVLTLLLPNTIHPFFAAVGAVFAVLVVKYSFGGLGANWLNPAIGGWLFIRFSWPNAFNSALQSSPLSFISGWMYESSTGQFASPVSILNKNGFGTQNGEMITAFLNKTLFSWLNVDLPSSYIDFFLNPGSGLIADRGVFALLAGSVIICATMVSRSYLSALYLAVFLVLVRLAGALPFGGPVGSGDMIFCLFSGATFAVAFFLMVEPATGPKSAIGRIAYVVCAALLAYFFRYIVAEGCGAIYAVVVMNMSAPLIRMIEERCYYERGRSLRSREHS